MITIEIIVHDGTSQEKIRMLRSVRRHRRFGYIICRKYFNRCKSRFRGDTFDAVPTFFPFFPRFFDSWQLVNTFRHNFFQSRNRSSASSSYTRNRRKAVSTRIRRARSLVESHGTQLRFTTRRARAACKDVSQHRAFLKLPLRRNVRDPRKI